MRAKTVLRRMPLDILDVIDADSLKELVYRLLEEKSKAVKEEKHGRLFRFFAASFLAMKRARDYWSNEAAFAAVAVAFAVVAATFAGAFAFAAGAFAFAAGAFAFAAATFAFVAAFAAVATTRLSLISLFISLCLSSISLWLSKGWPGILGLSLVFGFLIINTVVFMINEHRLSSKDKRPEQKLLTPDEVKTEIANYVNSIVNSFRRDYGLPQAQKELKLKLEQNAVLIKEIKERLKQKGDTDNQELELAQTLDLLENEQNRINTELNRFNLVDSKVIKVLGEAEGLILKIERKFGNRMLIERARKNIAEVDAILHKTNEELRAFILRLGSDLYCLKRVLLCLQAGEQRQSVTAADEKYIPLPVPSISAAFSMDQIEQANAILNGYLQKTNT